MVRPRIAIRNCRYSHETCVNARRTPKTASLCLSDSYAPTTSLACPSDRLVVGVWWVGESGAGKLATDRIMRSQFFVAERFCGPSNMRPGLSWPAATESVAQRW